MFSVVLEKLNIQHDTVYLFFFFCRNEVSGSRSDIINEAPPPEKMKFFHGVKIFYLPVQKLDLDKNLSIFNGRYFNRNAEDRKVLPVKNEKKKLLSLEHLVRKAGQSELSSIGSVVNRIMQLIRNPNSSAVELKGLIEIDPPLCAKILRRANSAYYGLKRRVSAIQEAIVMIGFNNIREMTLSMKIGKLFEDDREIGNYSRKKLWKHSLAVALCCKNIYRKEFREHGDDIYSTALLHDIGIMAEEQFMPEFFQEMMLKKVESQSLFIELEKSLSGYDHTDVGRDLVQSWKLPEEMTRAIAFHHRPLAVKPDFARLTMTIFIAEHICNINGFGFEGFSETQNENYINCLSNLKLENDNIEIIFEDVQMELEKMEQSGELYP